jgi:hypothetical protein
MDKKDLLDNHLEYTATHHQLRHDSDILHTNFDENGDGQISEIELASLFLKSEERKRVEADGPDWREVPYERTEVFHLVLNVCWINHSPLPVVQGDVSS